MIGLSPIYILTPVNVIASVKQFIFSWLFQQWTSHNGKEVTDKNYQNLLFSHVVMQLNGMVSNSAHLRILQHNMCGSKRTSSSIPVKASIDTRIFKHV